MSREQTRETLFAILKEQFGDGAKDVTESSTANDVVGWDSLAHVMLLGTIEKTFNVKFDFDDIVSFDNVGAILNCIVNKLN